MDNDRQVVAERCLEEEIARRPQRVERLILRLELDGAKSEFARAPLHLIKKLCAAEVRVNASCASQTIRVRFHSPRDLIVRRTVVFDDREWDDQRTIHAESVHLSQKLVRCQTPPVMHAVADMCMRVVDRIAVFHNSALAISPAMRSPIAAVEREPPRSRVRFSESLKMRSIARPTSFAPRCVSSVSSH